MVQINLFTKQKKKLIPDLKIYSEVPGVRTSTHELDREHNLAHNTL